jgi:cell shape-determining protein MreD
MKYFFCIVLSLIIAFIIHSQVSVFGVPPNITAAVAYYLGINRGAGKGTFFGSLIGIIEDSVTGSMLGPNLLGKGMVGFFSSFMSGTSGTLFRWTPLLGMIGIFILTAMDGLAVLLSRLMFETTPASLSNAILTLSIQGSLNLVLGIFLRPKNVE